MGECYVRCFLFHISLYYVNHNGSSVFYQQYMEQHDLAPGIHACSPCGGGCGMVLLVLGALSYTCTCETAAQCILPSIENTGLESKIGSLLIYVNIPFIILYQSLEGSIHPVFCINEVVFSWRS